jgi:hypothetical protein
MEESIKEPIGYHIRIRLRGNRVIAPTISNRLMLVRIVCKMARNDSLIAFSVGDTHLHLEVANNRLAAGRLVQRIESTARRRLDLKESFDEPYFKSIWEQQHLENTFEYDLTQNEHHGIGWDPYCETSNLLDLLGMRFVGDFTICNVRSFLPRVKRETLTGFLGVDPFVDVTVNPLLVTAAAAGVLGLPNLSGSSRPEMQARMAAAHVVGNQLSARQLARLLRTSERTLRRIRQRKPDPRLVRAIRLQMTMRQLKRECADKAERKDTLPRDVEFYG